MFELQTVVGLLLAAVPFSNKAKKKKSMLVTLSLLLVFLAPASQLTFNLEGRKASITRQTGSSVVITCGVLAQTITYMHWYKYQEGEAPERLLYYDFSKSKFVVESGIISGKYHAYKFTENSCKFVIRNLDRNDIGVYFCAAWDSHSDSALPRTAVKSLLVSAKGKTFACLISCLNFIVF